MSALLLALMLLIPLLGGEAGGEVQPKEAECIEDTSAGRDVAVFPSLGPLWYTSSNDEEIAVYPCDTESKLYGGGVSASTPVCSPEEWGKITAHRMDEYFYKVEFHLCDGRFEQRNLSIPESISFMGLGVWTLGQVEWTTCEPDVPAGKVNAAFLGGLVAATVFLVALIAAAHYLYFHRKTAAALCHGEERNAKPQEV